MFGNKTKSTLTFFYNTKDMFNDVSLLSSYMTKNLASESGTLMVEFIITDDEEDMYKECVRQALPNIYETLLKLTSGVDDAFADNVTVNADEKDGLKRVAGTYIEFNLKDNKAYNKNVLTLVDATLRDCIKYAILAEFYSICVNVDLQGIAQSKYASSMLQLNQRLFQLKKQIVYSHM